jgi:hypothetical protein
MALSKKTGLENYLVRLNEKTRIWMTSLRASNLRFPIETGRWYTIPKDERVCTLCGQSIGDEFQLLFVCCNGYLVNLRRIYLPRYYVTYPSIVKMNGLLSFCNAEVYERLSLFIKKIAGMF